MLARVMPARCAREARCLPRPHRATPSRLLLLERAVRFRAVHADAFSDISSCARLCRYVVSLSLRMFYDDVCALIASSIRLRCLLSPIISRRSAKSFLVMRKMFHFAFLRVQCNMSDAFDDVFRFWEALFWLLRASSAFQQEVGAVATHHHLRIRRAAMPS